MVAARNRSNWLQMSLPLHLIQSFFIAQHLFQEDLQDQEDVGHQKYIYDIQ